MPSGIYCRTDKTRKITSESLTGRTLSSIHKKNIGKANKGLLKDCKQSEEHKKNVIAGRKKNNKEWFSKETKVKMSKAKKGLKLTEEHIKGIRLAAIERVKEHHGICRPNFNLKACEYFKSFDNQNKTQGEYATSGGEHYIKQLGYFLDYFNSTMKIIMEWDEPYHKKQKEKDFKREKEIKKVYPSYAFVRITE